MEINAINSCYFISSCKVGGKVSDILGNDLKNNRIELLF